MSRFIKSFAYFSMQVLISNFMWNIAKERNKEITLFLGFRIKLTLTPLITIYKFVVINLIMMAFLVNNYAHRYCHKYVDDLLILLLGNSAFYNYQDCFTNFCNG